MTLHWENQFTPIQLGPNEQYEDRHNKSFTLLSQNGPVKSQKIFRRINTTPIITTPSVTPSNSTSKIILNCSANFSSLRIEDPKKSSQDSGDIHIKMLLQNIPEVSRHLQIAGKLGEGTFSKVYRARSQRDAKEYALKYLVPTVKPSRVATELRFMRDLGGVNNVIGLAGCFFSNGHTVIVMPIVNHDRFTDYVSDLSAEEIRDYMINLLIALSQVHSYRIIHRDVKPANFLFDRKNRRYALVDFGLAQSERDLVKLSMTSQSQGEQSKSRLKVQTQLKGNPVVSSASKVTVNPLKDCTFDLANNRLIKSDMKWQIRKRSLIDSYLEQNSGKPPKKFCANQSNIQLYPSVFNSPVTPSAFKTPIKMPVRKDQRFLTPGNTPTIVPETPPKTLPKNLSTNSPETSRQIPLQINETPKLRKVRKKPKKLEISIEKEKHSCKCFGKNRICEICKKKPELVAPRAGTPGFRAPEVLMKHLQQTTLIDLWSAGVIFACLLSGRYPFFRNIDDLTSLAEIISVLGTKRVERAAEDLNKKLTSSICREPLNLKEFCMRLRGDKNKLEISDSAFDLLDKLLEPSPTRRISAVQALEHQFFNKVH